MARVSIIPVTSSVSITTRAFMMEKTDGAREKSSI
jgi:hypothetical protein